MKEPWEGENCDALCDAFCDAHFRPALAHAVDVLCHARSGAAEWTAAGSTNATGITPGINTGIGAGCAGRAAGAVAGYAA
jgi:hypothetical protein